MSANDFGVDAVSGAISRAAAATDTVARAELIDRAIRTAFRTRQLHRLAGHEPLLQELDGPVLDLIDASRATLAGDVQGALSVLRVAAASVIEPSWVAATAGAAGDALITATHTGHWRDAAKLSEFIRELLRRIDPTHLHDRELMEIFRGVEFETLAAAALIEHHTSTLTEPRSTALAALAHALEAPRSRHLLGPEHAFALLAFGSVLNGRRELGPAAVALARAIELIPVRRTVMAEWARAELILVRLRQARWNDARRLAHTHPLDTADEKSTVRAAVEAVLAALDGRFSQARTQIEIADTEAPRSVITSALLTHARIASAIGRNNWTDLAYALEDLDQQNHRHVFDTHEWHALTTMTLWHLDRLDDYRALHTTWGTLPNADRHAYWWAHAAIIARIDDDVAECLAHTRRALDLLDDSYDPLGRTWVRILAGTHISVLDNPIEGLSCYEDARTELVALGAHGFATLCTGIIRTTSDQLAATQQDDPMAALTEQQRQVAQLVATGYTSIEIGELLHLSRKTIDFHVANILTRLGLRTRREISRAISPAAPDRI